jgi:hypothetical protein
MIEKLKFAGGVILAGIVFYGSLWLMLAVGIMAGL